MGIRIEPAGDLGHTDEHPLEAPPDGGTLLWSPAGPVPGGWRPMAALCATVAADLPALVERVVASIHEEIPSYRGSPVPADDLSASVTRNMEMMLGGIAERRGPRPAELAVGADLGYHRAAQGMPADDVIRAFHVGYRELWNSLVAAAATQPARTQALLLQAATMVWSWTHEFTSAVAETHRAATSRREALAWRVRKRLLDLLLLGEAESEEAHDAARALGFKPDAVFTAMVVSARDITEDTPERLQRELAAVGGNQHVVAHDPGLVILTQGSTPEHVEAALRGVLPSAAMGVGLDRPGLPGARLSVGDAERSLALAGPGTTSLFGHDWLRATLFDSRHRLAAVLEPGIRVAARYPHLADAVQAYADAGFSQSRAAIHLSVHPNTVTYRLARWADLTTWDPTQLPGLMSSLAAIQLGDSSPAATDRGGAARSTAPAGQEVGAVTEASTPAVGREASHPVRRRT